MARFILRDFEIKTLKNCLEKTVQDFNNIDFTTKVITGRQYLKLQRCTFELLNILDEIPSQDLKRTI